MSTAPSQDASSVEHLGELRDPYQAATFTDAATPVSSISEGLVFFHEYDILMLHEYTDSLPDLISWGVLSVRMLTLALTLSRNENDRLW